MDAAKYTPAELGISEETLKQFLTLQTQTEILARAFIAARAPAVAPKVKICCDLLQPAYLFRVSRPPAGTDAKFDAVLTFGVNFAHRSFAAVLPQALQACFDVCYGRTSATEIREENAAVPRLRLERCECAHISHFDHSCRDQFGRPRHHYGATGYHYVQVQNSRGNSHYVCPTCAADHAPDNTEN